MQELLKSLASHSDITIHIIGWLTVALTSVMTLLYKGIWARIKQQDKEHTQMRTDLDQLIGAHNVMCMNCGPNAKQAIVERRSDPQRVTIANYHEEEGIL